MLASGSQLRAGRSRRTGRGWPSSTCPWIPQLGHQLPPGDGRAEPAAGGADELPGHRWRWLPPGGRSRERVGFFHFNLLWVLAGIIGVFLALDLFLFYFFWEVMLVPLYFLIGIWGHERRLYAARQVLHLHPGQRPADAAGDPGALLRPRPGHGRLHLRLRPSCWARRWRPATAIWLMLGFFVAFAVKLPVVPFHTWLPDAHTEAPTAGRWSWRA